MSILSGISGNSTALSQVGVATNEDAATKKKLTEAAQQFEGMFLQQMLKPFRSGADAEGGEDKDAPPGSDTMASYGTEALANAIAKGGGLGIAKQIIAKVNLERHQHEARTVRSS